MTLEPERDGTTACENALIAKLAGPPTKSPHYQVYYEQESPPMSKTNDGKPAASAATPPEVQATVRPQWSPPKPPGQNLYPSPPPSVSPEDPSAGGEARIDDPLVIPPKEKKRYKPPLDLAEDIRYLRKEIVQAEGEALGRWKAEGALKALHRCANLLERINQHLQPLPRKRKDQNHG